MRRAATVGTAAVLTLTAVLSGCTDGDAPGATPTPRPSTSTGSASPEPRELRFSVYGGPQALSAYRDIADAFEADHPGVTVRISSPSSAPAAAADAFADRATPEESPTGSSSPTATTTTRAATPPDVFLLDEHYLPDLVSTDRLYPLDTDLEEQGVDFGDDFQRIALTAFSADAALQCMPFEMSPTVMFVNTRIVRYPRLEAEGLVPPAEDGSWRFADFAAAARFVVNDRPRPGLRAVYLPNDADLLSALLLTAGGDIVDQTDGPTTLTLDSDAGREVLTAMVELARERRTALTARQALRTSPVERFAQGRLAFLFGTRADVPELRRSGVPFDTLSVPGFGRTRTASAISGLCVDTESEVRDLAVEFVTHAVSEESLTRAASSGSLVPASLGVVNSPEFAQEGRRPRTVTPFIEGQKRSVLMPYSAGWRLAETRIEEMVARLVAGTNRDLGAVLDRELPQIDEDSQEWFEEG